MYPDLDAELLKTLSQRLPSQPTCLRTGEGGTPAVSAVALRLTPVTGGDISSAFQLEAGGQRWFVKLNRAGRLPLFEAEEAALRAMADTGAVRVPQPLACGTAGAQAFIVLEWLDLRRGNRPAAAALGTALAAMHRYTASQFGWPQDNFIGHTPQPNRRGNDWPTFWAEHRLGQQLRLAAGNGASKRLLHRGRQLIDRLADFFTGYTPAPSLLHGDLWAGNWGMLADGSPVLFDPASYYGDRETDLAMSELFGGFPPEFRTAYDAAYPLDSGYSRRRGLYQLYHVLNHYNLFRGSYGAQAERLLDELLRY